MIPLDRSRLLWWQLLWMQATLLAPGARGQVAIKLDGPSFVAELRDNVANESRQGSGFAHLECALFAGKNLFRNDAVGLNFEHIFNGQAKYKGIAMFTPRKDACTVSKLDSARAELFWPGSQSQWGLETRMIYDLAHPGQIDMAFECKQLEGAPSGEFVAMMWASYMQRARNRTIRFWGREGGRVGWVRFGESRSGKIEVGTVAHDGVAALPFEPGAQTLNTVEHPEKTFLLPFFYGLLDGDQNLKTKDDSLLYLMLFDQTDSIRFAMWNFIRDEHGIPDTHSPAWDWQYVIRQPEIEKTYSYRARLVVKPFVGEHQVWEEYARWRTDVGEALPSVPEGRAVATD